MLQVHDRSLIDVYSKQQNLLILIKCYTLCFTFEFMNCSNETFGMECISGNGIVQSRARGGQNL